MARSTDGRGVEVIRVAITIEPRFSYEIHHGVIEIDQREVAGMNEDQRRAYIAEQAEAYVSEEVQWGWSEDADEG